MTESLVSIIIPCFNSEATIEATLDNCLQQTYLNIEVLVIDDQSTDATSSIVLSITRNESRVMLIANETKGVQNARNLGLENAQGEFIKFLDSDDLMDLDLIRKQVDLISDSPESVVKSNWAKFSGSLASTRSEFQYCDKPYSDPADFLADLWNNCMYPPHAWLVPKSLLTTDLRWNTDLVQNQDGEFFARVISRARDVKHCRSTVYYRQPVGQDLNISQRVGCEAINSQMKTLRTYKTIVDRFQPNPAIMRAYNQQVFNVAYRASNSISEGKFLNDILNLMTTNESYQINISSTPLRLMMRILGVRKSLQIRLWFRCGH